MKTLMLLLFVVAVTLVTSGTGDTEKEKEITEGFLQCQSN